MVAIQVPRTSAPETLRAGAPPPSEFPAPRIYEPLSFPEDLAVGSMFPHMEALDFIGRVAEIASKLPADVVGWFFDAPRPWWRS